MPFLPEMTISISERVIPSLERKFLTNSAISSGSNWLHKEILITSAKEFSFFLSDKERVNYADEKIKTLVVSYLNLLKKLNFSDYFEKEEKECLDLWK